MVVNIAYNWSSHRHRFVVFRVIPLVTGPPNGPVLFCKRLSSCGPAGRQARGRSAPRRPGEWAVQRPTLHGGPVRLRPVRATPCCICIFSMTFGICARMGTKEAPGVAVEGRLSIHIRSESPGSVVKLPKRCPGRIPSRKRMWSSLHYSLWCFT